jgi:hypothetical protein
MIRTAGPTYDGVAFQNTYSSPRAVHCLNTDLLRPEGRMGDRPFESFSCSDKAIANLILGAHPISIQPALYSEASFCGAAAKKIAMCELLYTHLRSRRLSF